MNKNEQDFQQEILDELLESFTPAQFERMAAAAIDGKAQNVLPKFISNKAKKAAAANSKVKNILLVAKTFYNYTGTMDEKEIGDPY